MSNFGSLGVKAEYISKYDAKLLFPIERSVKRKELGLDVNNLPFYGIDLWNHYEVSWLNMHGKPMVALGVIVVPADSKYLIESKSMKLYFNSFNNTKFASAKDVVETVIRDLSKSCAADVGFELIDVDNDAKISKLDMLCLDSLDIEFDQYTPDPELLTTADNMVTTSVYSNLLKSNCLVTNQPDWGTVVISYTGNMINYEGLLRYIVSFRNHNEFHEQCVERIFNDILVRCKPETLTVYARYTRRGGLDINPYRTTGRELISSFYDLRFVRQ